MGVCLNGTKYSTEEIKELAVEKLNTKGILEIERDYFSFILDWFNGLDFVILKTSGSTGTPKKIKILKENLVKSAKRSIDFFRLEENSNALLCLSPNYIAGKLMIVRSIVGSFNLILVEPTGNPLKEMENCSIDFAAMVPIQLFNCLEDQIQTKILSRIKTLIIGGGSIGQSISKKLNSFPNKIYLTYGMTETLTHIAIMKLSGKDRSDFFQTLPGIIIGQDNRGCLTIKTDYRDMDELVTNDLVELKDDFSFVWKGRFDNIINSGGIKLIPELIENKLGENLLGRRFFISGLNDEKFGEILVAYIEGTPFTKQEELKIWEHIKKRLLKVEVPKKLFYRLNFKETKTKKIQRVKTIKQEH